MSKGTPRTIYLTADLEERLLTRALAVGRSASWVIREVLERELACTPHRSMAGAPPSGARTASMSPERPATPEPVLVRTEEG